MVYGWEDDQWLADEDELLPEQTVDDTDRGWSERPREDDIQRLLRERPPHHRD